MEGHIAGVNRVREIVKYAANVGIEALTLYTFSTENWSRPKSEVKGLMTILKTYLRSMIDELHENKVKLGVIGEIEGLPADVREEVRRCMRITSENNGLKLSLALNYGGRAEIVTAARAMAQDVSDGRLSISRIDSELFERYLWTRDLPDPDLLIRTGGDMRVSNFLLWQIAYSEVWVTETFWPDFGKERMLEALLDYQNRCRRFGSR